MQIPNDPALFWIGLSSIPGVGRVTFRKLKNHFGSPEHALFADREQLTRVDGVSDKVISEITAGGWKETAEQELIRARESGVEIVTADSKAYPTTLLNTPDPPLFLYVKGKLPARPGVAIVGTRRPTHYGVTATRRIASDIASAGFTVVSGLARGIDTQAHKGALAAGGTTIAVLGCGIDVVYPPENKGLLEEIIRSGAVVTENPFGTKPEAGYFPARNRIISGLSAGTVIVEATEDSGSLITAEYTRSQGRKLFAVPGSIVSPYSRGANSLIKQGALLVENAGDILTALHTSGGKGPEKGRENPQPALQGNEETIFRCITSEPKHIDVIMNESKTRAGAVSAVLVGLELKGLVKQLPGKYYVREEL